MIISLNWIKRYLPSLDASVDQIDKALTAVGLEVEGVENLGEPYEKLIVAKVLECAKHPEADKLSITKVFNGTEEIQIVCGAPNVAAGQTVVLAPVGSKLPLPDGGELKLKKAKIRGVESFGMICAEDEIGLGSSHDGILVLDEALEAGKSIVDLGFYDTLFEINVTPNRPDALCHLGVARELAAYFGVERVFPSAQEPTLSAEKIEDLVSLDVDSSAGCTKYLARVIKGVKVGPTPDFIKKPLEAVGIRSISNVVDITNYVLLEYGQPLHAFDLNKMSSNKVGVRLAKAGEKLTTLDEVERDLIDSDMIITDGDKPACLAGVMGGLESEVGDSTTDVLLETAYFNPSVVRKQARRLGISSDSSYRFERGIDPFMQEEVSLYAAKLIVELCGGELVDGVVSVVADNHQKEEIHVSLRYARVGKILGFNPERSDIESKLNGIGLSTVSSDDDSWVFSIPGARPDLTREIDLIEEVARLCGFDNVPTVYPQLRLESNPIPASEKLRRQVRSYFVANGLNEGLSLRFVKKSDVVETFGEGHAKSDYVELENPLSEEWAVLPTSHLPKFLKQISFNNRNQEKYFRVFELNRAFFNAPDLASPKHPGVIEKENLSGVIAGIHDVTGNSENPELADILYAKSIVAGLFKTLQIDVEFVRSAEKASYFHPLKQLDVLVKGEKIGEIGEVHPGLGETFGLGMTACFFELDYTKLIELSGVVKKFKPFSKFGEVKREITLITDERLDHGDVMGKISKIKVKNLVDVKLKSIYRGENVPEGKKAVSYQFIFQSPDKTLVDADVNKAQDKLSRLLGEDDDIEYR